MDDRKYKIDRFLKDEMMADAVFSVIRDSFLTSKGQRDVQLMAAERLAIDLLKNGWKELEKYRIMDDDLSPGVRQIGL